MDFFFQIRRKHIDSLMGTSRAIETFDIQSTLVFLPLMKKVYGV